MNDLILLAALIAAMFLGHIIPVSYQLVIIIATIVIVITYREATKDSSPIPLILITLLGLITLRTIQTTHLNYQPFSSYQNRQISIEGIITSSPKETVKDIDIIISHAAIVQGSTIKPVTGSVTAQLPLFSKINYGDKVILTGKIQSSEQQPDLSYRSYLLNHQIYGEINRPVIKVIAHHQAIPLVSWAIDLQRICQQALSKLLPQDEAALLLGIVLGLQQPISDTFTNALKNTGTTHIIVASGYNMTIAMVAVLKLAPLLKRQRVTWLAIISGLAYMVLSGLGPSIIRAFIMSAITLGAIMVGRQRGSIRLVVLAAMVMILINPLWLLDTSFQLSFAASLGILLFQPTIATWFNRLPGWIAETASVTIAAQILVYPILIITFGSVSIFGMIANLLVLWVVPYIMALGAIFLMIAILLPIFAQYLTLLLEIPLWYVKQSIILSARLPLAAVSLQLSWLICLPYYALLYFIALNKRDIFTHVAD